jgi:hypothetical protein
MKKGTILKKTEAVVPPGDASFTEKKKLSNKGRADAKLASSAYDNCLFAIESKKSEIKTYELTPNMDAQTEKAKKELVALEEKSILLKKAEEDARAASIKLTADMRKHAQSIVTAQVLERLGDKADTATPEEKKKLAAQISDENREKVAQSKGLRMAEVQRDHTVLANVSAAAASMPHQPSIVQWKPHQVRTAQSVKSGQMLPTFEDFCRDERTSLMASLEVKGVKMSAEKIHKMAEESAQVAATQGKCQPQGAAEVMPQPSRPPAHPLRPPAHPRGTHGRETIFSELTLCPGLKNLEGCKYQQGQGSQQAIEHHFTKFYHPQD